MRKHNQDNLTESEALVVAARHYCIDNFRYWSDKYSKERTGNDFPYTYTDNDYNLFPRYNVLAAIRQGVEYYTGQEFEDIETSKQALKKVGQESQSLFTTGEKNKTEQKAMQEERDKFIDFISNIDNVSLQNIEPLPYRRRLKNNEQEKIRQKLKKLWKVDGYWVPLIETIPDIKTIFFNKEHLMSADYKKIIDFIIQKSDDRIYEITEDQLDYECDVIELDLDCYETFYCDKEMTWLVYGSHEGTIAFGGNELADFVSKLFVERKDLINKW